MARTDGPGRARGRFDDLVYEPDPLGRVGKGRWVRRDDLRAPVADNPDAAVERLRAAWRDGELDATDPDDLFELDNSVGPRGRNGKLDVAKVETLLAAADAFDLEPTDGPTGNFSNRRADAIRDFQRVNGLRVDGLIEPGGETVEALRLASTGHNRRGLPVPVNATLPGNGAAAPSPARRKPAPKPARRKPKPPARTPPGLVVPTPYLRRRGKDREGGDNFTASRDNGKRQHEALDLYTEPGDPITSAATGKVTKIGYPYQTKRGKRPRPGDHGQPHPYRYVEETTPDGFAVRLLYVKPSVSLKVGDSVKAGVTQLGTAQDLRRRNPRITNHTHLELRDTRVIAHSNLTNRFKRYKAHDPEPLLFEPISP